MPEDIVLPDGAIVVYDLGWSMEGGPRLAGTADATAVVMMETVLVVAIGFLDVDLRRDCRW